MRDACNKCTVVKSFGRLSCQYAANALQAFAIAHCEHAEIKSCSLQVSRGHVQPGCVLLHALLTFKLSAFCILMLPSMITAYHRELTDQR